MKFASLGSGSEGNGLLISSCLPAAGGAEEAATTILLDCGFGLRETQARLARLGIAAEELSGILVTHEHQDHVCGVFKLARRFRLPVWLSYGTYRAVQAQCEGLDIRFCRDGETFTVGALRITPYTVPHDAREPLQYCVQDDRYKLGVLTDAGCATPHLISSLGGCHALVLECNYDLQMLAQSHYPPSLKRRIGGDFGHLSNDMAAHILAALDQTNLRIVVGAHLSTKNNLPELAFAALVSSIQPERTKLSLACQEQGLDWVAV